MEACRIKLYWGCIVGIDGVSERVVGARLGIVGAA